MLLIKCLCGANRRLREWSCCRERLPCPDLLSSTLRSWLWGLLCFHASMTLAHATVMPNRYVHLYTSVQCRAARLTEIKLRLWSDLQLLNCKGCDLIKYIYVYIYIYIYISAVKRLIAINCIQNKSFCLHKICVCAVYIYYAYIKTHTCMYVYILKIFTCIYLYSYKLCPI